MIDLIHDPYGLCVDDFELCVDSPATRLQAYELIDSYLRTRDDDTEIQKIRIDTVYWRQFKSAYEGIPHVFLTEVTPFSVLAKRVGRKPPVWLNDQWIQKSGLAVNGRRMADNESWPKWIAESIFPKVNVESYDDWLRAAYDCTILTEDAPEEIVSYLLSRFRLLLQKNSLVDIVIEQVMQSISVYASFHRMVEVLLVSPAVAPLFDLRPISGMTADRLLSKRVPLVFPLPPLLQQKVSALFGSEIRTKRLGGDTLSGAVMLLNAEWDNVSDELANWLSLTPAGLSQRAAAHLEAIADVNENSRYREFSRLYAPGEPPQKEWRGADGLAEWSREYCTFVRRSFLRRSLPESWDQDPAHKFTDWIQEEAVSLYNDPNHSFVKVARNVRKALAENKTVILCVLDAFAYHLEDIFGEQMSAALGNQPTSHECIFAPVPTVTEIAKNSVATGLPPNQKIASFRTALCEVYSLKPEEVLVAKEWKDINRVQPGGAHRLIVYLDNRIDDALENQSDYAALRAEVCSFSADIAKRVRRWVNDLEHVQGQRPVVICTADHGFTYGPPSDRRGSTVQVIGHHRCLSVDEDTTMQVPSHLARLGKNEYLLPKSYLAATKRGVQETISGWVMQHGGLLPEEVLIPLIMWHGSDATPCFADVCLLGSLEKADAEHWKLSYLVKNNSGLQLDQIQLFFSLHGQEMTNQLISGLRPDEERRQTVILSVNADAVDNFEEMEVMIHQTVAGRSAPRKSEKVGVHRMLMQPDQEFEDMF
jgi:hypothetical protein